MNGKISVIIPMYNREIFIEECVDSVLNQSYDNFEIILIDDGSNDGTLDICRALSKKDERIKLLTGKHLGVSAARNIGLDAAEGEYVFFLDSDDIIHPFLLETLCLSMKSNGVSMAGTSVITITKKNWDMVKQKITESLDEGITIYHTNIDTINEVFRTKTPFSVIGGVMMRRDLIGATRFNTELYIGEDFYFIYENLIKGTDTVYLKQKWYLARWHKNNISQNYDHNAFFTRFYRRVLVWRNEEALGRKENANLQKLEAPGLFLKCYWHSKNNKIEIKKMRNTLKEYRKEITSTLSLVGKIRHYCAIYFPPLYNFIRKMVKKKKNKDCRLTVL